MYEELIQVQGTAARIACAGLTARQLAAIEGAVQHAARLPAETDWECRVTAFGQVLPLLAVAAADSVVASVLSTGADHLRDLVIGVGPAATGLVASSHRRLLAHLQAGDAVAAATELENLFRGLQVLHSGDRAGRQTDPAAT